MDTQRTARRIAAGTVLAIAVSPLAVARPAVAAPPGTPPPSAGPAAADPIVVGHRGASGHRPEHTLAAYRLAIRQGADYVEPDLVATRDGVLVARHENEISGTTDVADRPEFADRYTTRTVDGRPVTGWFTEDFTLAELKTLRAVERLPEVRPESAEHDGRYQVPTFEEVLAMVDAEEERTGRTIGVYPETKHPTYFDSIGLSLEEPLVAMLRAHRLHRRTSPVIVQSFETANLRELDRMVQVPLAQLVNRGGRPYDLAASGDPRSYADLVTPRGLRWVATYADGVGVNKDLVLPRDAAGAVTGPSEVVDDAHEAGLAVHVWTLRVENMFMATDFRLGTDPTADGDLYAETKAFLDAGVDGVFSDNPDVAVAALTDWLAER